MDAATNSTEGAGPSRREPSLGSLTDEENNKTHDQQIENTSKEKAGALIASKNWVTHRLRTRKRKWICCAVSGIIIAAVAFPLIFLVIYPAIAQGMLNHAKIPISAVTIAKPNTKNALLSLKASIKLPTPLHVRTEPVPLNLYIKNGSEDSVPYTSFVLPANKLVGNTTLEFQDQLVQILDEKVFAEFVQNAIFSESFMLSVTGQSNAYVGRLKAHIHLTKDIPLVGLNNMTGFAIPSAHLRLPADSDGTNLLADLFIPNPSVFTLDLGNTTWNVLIGGYLLGNARMQNVVIVPGNNTIPARCTLDLKALFHNLGDIISAVSGPLKNGMLEISATGNSTIYDGEHLIYYEQSLNRLTLSAQVPLLSLLVGALPNGIGALPPAGTPLNASTIANISSAIGALIS